jgi:hypothetical protein
LPPVPGATKENEIWVVKDKKGNSFNVYKDPQTGKAYFQDKAGETSWEDPRVAALEEDDEYEDQKEEL